MGCIYIMYVCRHVSSKPRPEIHLTKMVRPRIANVPGSYIINGNFLYNYMFSQDITQWTLCQCITFTLPLYVRYGPIYLSNCKHGTQRSLYVCLQLHLFEDMVLYIFILDKEMVNSGGCMSLMHADNFSVSIWIRNRESDTDFFHFLRGGRDMFNTILYLNMYTTFVKFESTHIHTFMLYGIYIHAKPLPRKYRRNTVSKGTPPMPLP